MKSWTYQTLGRAASLLAVILWFGAAGWHGVFHAGHEGGAHHAECGAAHHKPSHDETRAGAGIAPAESLPGHAAHDALCHACTVASSVALGHALPRHSPLLLAKGPIAATGGRMLSADAVDALRLRGPPA